MRGLSPLTVQLLATPPAPRTYPVGSRSAPPVRFVIRNMPPSSTATLPAPLAPPALAVMVVFPAPTAFTIPVRSTVAAVGLLLDQVIGRRNTRLPAASRSATLSRAESPTSCRSESGDMVTVAEGPR